MFLLKLFHQSAPTRQIEARTLGEGELAVGRDPGQGWKIEDPDRQISRLHCIFAASGGRIQIKDMSSNGLSIARLSAKPPRDVFTPLQLGDTVGLGRFIISVEVADALAMGTRQIDQAPAPASPFAPQSGHEYGQGLSRPAPVDPFASALKQSPLDRDVQPLRGASAFGEDAWATREAPKAGDWDQSAQARRKSHDDIIGTPLDWSEPPKEAAPERGFGFDAPFHKPILRAEPIGRDALTIPSNWDVLSEEAPPPKAPNLAFADFRPPPSPPSYPNETRGYSASPFQDAPLPPLSYEDPPRGLDGPAADHAEPGFRQPAPPLGFEGWENATSPPPPRRAPPPLQPPVSPPPRPMAEPLARAPEFAPPPVYAAPPIVQAEPPKPAEIDLRAHLQAFCEGADLDPREFEGEDPAVVLRRAGALYQQMVLGLCDLLNERTTLKNEYRMVRTTVAAEGNNPFKWAPARRVGVDLLRSNNQGYLTGPPAVREACEDLKKHLLCLLAGMRASLEATFKALSPMTIEAQGKDQSFLKNKRASSAWATYTHVYQEFRQAADDNADSQINREFRAAYERQLGELDGLRSNDPR